MADTIAKETDKLALDDKTKGEAPAADDGLVLDEQTGDKVSKAELKRRIKKREKDAKKSAYKAKEAEDKAAAGPKPSKANAPAKKVEEPADPEAMFKQGFLDDVYKLRPEQNVVTRFPPSPTASCTLDTPKPLPSTSASPSSTAASATCVSTIPTQRPRRRYTSRPSRTWCGGLVLPLSRSHTLATTSKSSMTWPRS